MYSIVLGLALATTANSSAANLPTWQTDYRQAKVVAARDHKPLAVVIGNGSAGWEGVVAGTLSENAAQVLRNAYVCVYIDANTEAGKKLAGEFEATGTPTLVISDKTGEKQAYRHAGSVSSEQVATVLTRYAEPNVTVTTTEVGNQPAAPAVNNSRPFYYPVQSSCPNCRN
ncbi:MAG: hypothetical protein K1X57_08740 [Gemmataceae bacterium]|nr:hypothetical protein [Gemmataceae bacterium]